MPDIAEKLLLLFIDVILPLFLGFFMRRHGLMSLYVCNLLLKINVRAVVTVTALGSFWLVKLDYHILWLVLLGIVSCSIVPGLMGYCYARKRIPDLIDRGSYLLSTMLSNTGTLGGLCIFIAIGQLAYAYVQIVAMAQNIFTFTYCFPLAEYYRQKYNAGEKAVRFNPNWKAILISWNQIGLVAMVVGGILNFCEVPRPDQFDIVFNTCVHISAWLGVLPVGYLLNFAAAKKYKQMALSIVPNRFIITPLVCYLTAICFTEDPMLIAVAVMMGLCPVGMTATALTQLYKLNTDISQSNFLITTILFVFIVYPLFLLFFL